MIIYCAQTTTLELVVSPSKRWEMSVNTSNDSIFRTSSSFLSLLPNYKKLRFVLFSQRWYVDYMNISNRINDTVGLCITFRSTENCFIRNEWRHPIFRRNTNIFLCGAIRLSTVKHSIFCFHTKMLVHNILHYVAFE